MDKKRIKNTQNIQSMHLKLGTSWLAYPIINFHYELDSCSAYWLTSLDLSNSKLQKNLKTCKACKIIINLTVIFCTFLSISKIQRLFFQTKMLWSDWSVYCFLFVVFVRNSSSDTDTQGPAVIIKDVLHVAWSC